MLFYLPKRILGWTLGSNLVSAILEVDNKVYVGLCVAMQESMQRTTRGQGDGHQMNKWTDSSLGL